MPGNRLKGKRDVMVTEYSDPGGQRNPALRQLQTHGHNSQTRLQKVKGDLFILGEKSRALGGKTRVVIALNKDTDFDIVKMLPLKNIIRRLHGLETWHPNIFH
jgi:hypothetical protein